MTDIDELQAAFEHAMGALSAHNLDAFAAVLHPTFKGVWSTEANFAPLPLPDTKPGQYLRRHKR